MEILNSVTYEQTERLVNLISVFTNRFEKKPEVVIRVPGIFKFPIATVIDILYFTTYAK